MANDVEVLYDAVKSGRVKLEDLSDKGLNALKTYVYTKDKNFSTEQPQAAKMTQQAMEIKKKTQAYNYADSSLPQAALQNQMKNNQLNKPNEFNYPSTQPKEAMIQRDNVRARYTGTPPAQANVGQSFKKDLPNYAAVKSYPVLEPKTERGFLGNLINNVSLAADKATDSPEAFRASLGQFIGGTLGGLSLGLSDSSLIPESMRKTEQINQSILGKENAETIKTVGDIVGSLTPIGMSYKLASKGVSLLPKMNKFATSATKGALAGGAYQTAVESVDQTVGREEKSLADSALNIGLATGIGAVADPLFLLAPELVKALGRKAQEEVAGIAANLYTKLNTLNERELSNLAASKYGGEKGLAKKLTGASNMQRYQKSILSEDEIRSIRRKNADLALREIADQQSKYVMKHQELSKAFSDMPTWEKQRAMELYNQSIKDQPKVSDFASENIRMNRQKDIESTLARLSELDQAFKDLPTEAEMAMDDFGKQIKTRGQLMDQRQKDLNKVLGTQAKIDNYQIEKERILTEVFDQLPQMEKDRLLQEYLDRAKQMPKIQDMTSEKRQAKYRDEVTPIFERELNRQDQADTYARMFDEIQQRERQAELQNTPDIRQFSSENIRKQNQQKFDDMFGKLAEKESKRSEDQILYERLFEQRDNEIALVQKQINEIDQEIDNVNNQIKLLDNQREKEILNVTNSYWNELKGNRKKLNTYDPIMEEIKNSGFIKVPNSQSFYYEEYKNLPSQIKRKYFRDSNNALQIDEMSDAMGITANELLIKLRQGNSSVIINQTVNDLIKQFGNNPTKTNVEQFVREQIDNGKLPINEMIGLDKNRNGLESVLDYLKKDRSELIRKTGQNTNTTKLNLSDIPKAQNNKSVTSPVSKIPSKKKDVKAVEKAQDTFDEFTEKMRTGAWLTKDELKEYNEVREVLKSESPIQKARKENQQRLEMLKDSESSRMGIVPLQQSKLIVPKADQSVERAITATRTIPNRIKQMFNKVNELKENFLNDFRIRPTLRATDREDFNVAEIKFKDAWNQAAKDIADIMNHFRSEQEYELFRRIVVLRDLNETASPKRIPEQLKQIQDEIKNVSAELDEELLLNKNKLKIERLKKQLYTLNARINPILPKGVTKEAVQDWLSYYENLAAKNINVTEGLESYENLMKAIAQDLVNRQKLSAESVRDSYFPHRILDKAFSIQIANKGDGIQKVKSPFRFYTKERLGSVSDIDTDFESVMTDVLSKIYLDNEIDDFAGRISQKTDILSEVKESMVRDPKDLLKLNRAYLANDKSGKSKAIFYKQQTEELERLGIQPNEIQKYLKDLWENEVKNSKDPFVNGKLIDKDSFEYNGERYRFWLYDNQIRLIPENVFKELEAFKNPPIRMELVRWMNIWTQYLKSALLVSSGSAYQIMNLAGNTLKLGFIDPVAFKYIGSAARILLTKDKLDNNIANEQFRIKLNDILKKGLGDRKPLDKQVEQFALDKGIIEPTRESGIYRFTPLWKKIVYHANPLSRNNALFRLNTNVSQLGDEVFRLMKLAADLERQNRGEDPVHRGIINLDGLTDKEQIVTKVAREFFVDPAKQSPTMQTAVTQLVFPFINWFLVTTQHLGRYAINNKKTTAALLSLPIAMETWNNTGNRGDIEKDLDPKKRAIPHIITGHLDEQGKPLIIYLTGEPVSAALSLFGLNYVPQNVTDAVLNRKPTKEVVSEQLNRIASSQKTNAESFLNPLGKVPLELIRNRSYFTDQIIVPEGEEGTTEAKNKRMEYVLKNLVPPYRMIQTAENQVNREADPQNSAAKALLNWINPVRTMIQKEDMDWQRRNRNQERTEKLIQSVNQARVDFIQALVLKDEVKANEVISRKLLTKDQVENIRRNPFNQLKQLREEIANSTDSAERQAFLDQINEVSKRIEKEKIRQLPKSIRKEAMEGRQ